MTGQLVGQRDALMGPQLRRQRNGPDFLHLRVVRGTDAINVTRNLRAEVGNHDELAQNILGEHIGEPGFLKVIRRHINVVGAQVEVGAADGAHTPIGFAAECLLLVVAGSGNNHFFAVHIRSFGCGFSELALFAGLWKGKRQRGKRARKEERNKGKRENERRAPTTLAKLSLPAAQSPQFVAAVGLAAQFPYPK